MSTTEVPSQEATRDASAGKVDMKLEVVVISVSDVERRLSGRIDSGVTSYCSASDLASAMRRAEAAHGEHEINTAVTGATFDIDCGQQLVEQ